MAAALYLNGVYESVLEEIRHAQKNDPEQVCFLQPYADNRITLLADDPPARHSPVRLYLSLTGSLSVVSYRALIVGWHDKRELTEGQLIELNRSMAALQPKEKEVSLKGVGDKPAVNLISVVQLELLPEPIPVSSFVKTSDETPLRKRTRAGGWSYVYEQPEWVGTLSQTVVGETLERRLAEETRLSAALTDEARQALLQAAPRLPERVQVLTYGFIRSAHVRAAVLKRANGKCERCGNDAPFTKLSTGEPYLEVHHKVMLAHGGEDTVDNTFAVCPNCHRHLHYGGGEI